MLLITRVGAWVVYCNGNNNHYICMRVLVRKITTHPGIG